MSEPWPFGDLKRGHYGALLADPPWHFETWVDEGTGLITGKSSRKAERHYSTMTIDELSALPVREIAAPVSVLFMWVTWPLLERALSVIDQWGFTYKTCAFDWMKANAKQMDLWRDDADVQVGMGWWTRANSEPCLLATRGKPKRLNADVRQGIIAPRREHSRKPDCIHQRIERLVAGPYCELFAREAKPGWDCWGNETGKFNRSAA